MNSQFLNLLRSKHWEERSTMLHNGHYKTDYVKVFPVDIGNAEIVHVPIAVHFTNLDKKNFPKRAWYSFVQHPKLSSSYANRSVNIRGVYKVMAMLDCVGYMTALKYVIYGKPVGDFKQEAQIILASANILPT